MSEGTVSLEYAKFAVVDRALCVWGRNVSATNLRYLKNLDPDFFLYQAHVHESAIAGAGGPSAAEARHAVLALRIAHGLAVETFFALLGAALQAPHCVFGWLSLYQTEELRAFVSRLRAKEPLRALPPFRPPSWEQIARITLGPIFERAPEVAPAARDRFCRAWQTLADEFLDRDSTREFNSLKHAFRVEPGRGPLRVQLVAEGGTAFEATTPVAHGFPTLTRMPEKGRRHHYNMGHAAYALEPAALVASLKIVACSIHNLLAVLRVHAGDSPEANSARFFGEDTISEFQRREAPIQRIAYGGRVSVADHEYWSEEEILSIYDDAEAEGAPPSSDSPAPTSDSRAP